MTRTMGDSTTFSDIPKGVEVAAVYVSGKLGVVAPAELEARFPHSQYGHCTIDVNGSRPDADVRDWETGDKAGNLQQWVIDHNKTAGVQNKAVVYCNRSTIFEVRQLTGSQILGKDYFLWVTTLDGTEYTGTGVIACQSKGEQQTGGHWDESVIYDDRFWKALESVPTTGAKAAGKPSCVAFQKAVRTTADDLWGSDTDKHAMALKAANTRTFPYGVEFTQQVVGTTQDGIWGINSQTAMKDTVAVAQRALNGMGFPTSGVDGIWGKNTDAAYAKARAACHI